MLWSSLRPCTPPSTLSAFPSPCSLYNPTVTETGNTLRKWLSGFTPAEDTALRGRNRSADWRVCKQQKGRAGTGPPFPTPFCWSSPNAKNPRGLGGTASPAFLTHTPFAFTSSTQFPLRKYQDKLLRVLPDAQQYTRLSSWIMMEINSGKPITSGRLLVTTKRRRLV